MNYNESSKAMGGGQFNSVGLSRLEKNVNDKRAQLANALKMDRVFPINISYQNDGHLGPA